MLLSITQAVLMGFVFVNWLRVFETTVIYIRLIKQTMIDMTPFFFLYVVITVIFSFAVLILNLNREDENDLYDNEIFASSYLNSFMSQYLVTLGEFSLDHYSKAGELNAGIDWSFFIAATVFGQLVILNMLIAIMSNTFDKIFENQTQFKLQLKLEVLNDYSFLFKRKDLPDFLFVAKLKDSDGETGEEWEGRIKAMTKSIRGRFEVLKTEILAKIKG